MSDEQKTDDSSTAVKQKRRGLLFDVGGDDIKRARQVLATVVNAVCIVFALALALTALLVLIDANVKNEGVRFLANLADKVDFGFFDLTSPIKDFDKSVKNPADDAKTALFNYGIAAAVWVLIGRVLSRLLRSGV